MRLIQSGRGPAEPNRISHRCRESESLLIATGSASVVRAWYGDPRFAFQTGPYQGYDVTVHAQCMLAKSTTIVASRERFGDPCPGKSKELLVECQVDPVEAARLKAAEKRQLDIIRRDTDARTATEHPPADETFYLEETTSHVDGMARRYLDLELQAMAHNMACPEVVPMSNIGDGACMVRAASRALWGTEEYHKLLRAGIYRELTENVEYYQRVLHADYDRAVDEASRNHAYLSLGHVAALSNYLRRPVFLVDQSNQIRFMGCGYNGCCGAFVPLRHPVQGVVSRQPIVIAWSGSRHCHFVPLVPVWAASVTGHLPWLLPHSSYTTEGGQQPAGFDRAYVDCTDGTCFDYTPPPEVSRAPEQPDPEKHVTFNDTPSIHLIPARLVQPPHPVPPARPVQPVRPHARATGRGQPA